MHNFWNTEQLLTGMTNKPEYRIFKRIVRQVAIDKVPLGHTKSMIKSQTLSLITFCDFLFLLLKPRSNELNFSNTTGNICRTFGCTLLHVVGSLRGQTHQTFCRDICSKLGASYRNKRNVL